MFRIEPNVRKALPRYTIILQGNVPKFVIARKIPVDIEKEPWKEHERAIKDFYIIQDRIDNKEIEMIKAYPLIPHPRLKFPFALP